MPPPSQPPRRRLSALLRALPHPRLAASCHQAAGGLCFAHGGSFPRASAAGRILAREPHRAAHAGDAAVAAEWGHGQGEVGRGANRPQPPRPRIGQHCRQLLPPWPARGPARPARPARASRRGHARAQPWSQTPSASAARHRGGGRHPPGSGSQRPARMCRPRPRPPPPAPPCSPPRQGCARRCTHSRTCVSGSSRHCRSKSRSQGRCIARHPRSHTRGSLLPWVRRWWQGSRRLLQRRAQRHSQRRAR